MSLLFSIVVPVYNRAECVVRTLDSISASVYHPAELLIVDNGSTDRSLEVCRQWAEAKDSDSFHVKVLSEPRRGGNFARNRGLASCRGAYVLFFDSDDLFCGEALSDVAEALKEEDADMLFMPVEQEVNGRVSVRAYRQSASPHVHLLNSMFLTACMVFRTEWLCGIGGWNERLSVWQDWELGVRVLLRKPRLLWLCKRSYHRILVHPESVSGANFGQTLEGTLGTMRCVLDELRADSALTQTERSRALRALYYRAMIMAGKLRKEGNMRGYSAYRELAEKVVPHAGKPLKMIGMMLSLYTAAGGRGAWRVALSVV